VGGQFDPDNGGSVPVTPFVGTGVNVGDGQVARAARIPNPNFGTSYNGEISRI
jgi:hypothetical protein